MHLGKSAGRHFPKALPSIHLSPTKSGLSARELTIAQLVISGRSSKEIAKALAISPATVRKHRENILRRAGVHSAVQLSAWWSQP
ncbi:helix-turn-helix domain-containing protein [Paraburkholderia caribensis]|uniref:response regulator transcription factor n=1 Tax=Paraburkholderia caribensis TaxID=75105 RepID=UPI0009E6AFD1